MTVFHTSFTHFLMDFSRLSGRLSAQGVVSTTVSTISRLAGQVRVRLSLQIEGRMLADSSAGQILPGEPHFVFSHTFQVQGQEYGTLLVEFLSPSPGRETPGRRETMVALLETLALQLALYADLQRLKQAQSALRHQHAHLQEVLTTEKAVIRAAGVLAQSRDISLAVAEQWIRFEAVRRDRTPLSLAEMVITTLLPQTNSFRSQSRPGQPRGVAA
jgi:hypothetical protein